MKSNRSLSRSLAFPLSVGLLMGCAATPTQMKDRQLYRAMQVERKALRLEEKNANLTNVNALQAIIDRNGFERSRLEGYMK